MHAYEWKGSVVKGVCVFRQSDERDFVRIITNIPVYSSRQMAFREECGSDLEMIIFHLDVWRVNYPDHQRTL